MSKNLAEERYVSIETVRKNGTTKATPIWIAPLDGKLVAVTDPTSWKIKRIRNNPAVRLAPCNMKGEDVGEYRAGTALVHDDGDARDRIQVAINQKYGWQTWPFRMMAFFKRSQPCGVEITLTD